VLDQVGGAAAVDLQGSSAMTHMRISMSWSSKEMMHPPLAGPDSHIHVQMSA
jgi:hypothetical protein